MPDQDPILTDVAQSTDSISTRATPSEPETEPDPLLSQGLPSYLDTRAGDEPTTDGGSGDSIATRSPGDTYATAWPGASPVGGPEPRHSGPIPGFELLEAIGEGGMGVVYKARQAGLNRIVAIKMVLGGHYAGPKELIRFLAEAEAVASVRHPNVVQVHEFGQAEGRPFLALEYLPGGSLADRIRGRRRLDPGAAAGLLIKLAGAVQAAHDQGIVHRDIKPANVLFDAQGEPKVTDFGLAKRTAGNDLTQTQSVMGTPAYMSPEQARGETKFVGPQADIYALGVVLYECLTGYRPFRDSDTHVLLRRVIEDEPERPSWHVPGLPRDLELIALKCLAKDPADRYPTAKELAEDLGRFAAGEPVSVRAAGVAERALKWARRKPTLAASYALTAAVLVLLTFGASLAVLWRSAERERLKAEKSRDEAAGLYYKADASQKEADRQKQSAVLARDAERKAREEAVRARDGERRARIDYALAQDRFDRVEYGRAVQAAHKEWAQNRTVAALAWLNGARENLRGWEWKYVDRLCHVELLTLEGHGSGVTSASFSPDGERVLTGSWDSTARIWDARTGSLLRTIQDDGTVDAASWSPDGLRLATGGTRKTARIWDARTGSLLHTLRNHNETVHSTAWSPDGRRLVTGGGDKMARVWDTRTGAELMVLKGHDDQVFSASFSPDGTRLATGGVDTTARIWDAHTGAELLVLREHYGWIKSVSWSPNSLRLATAGGDSTVWVWDARTGAMTLRLRQQGTGMYGVSWSPDGSRLVTASHDKLARIWDAHTGAELLALKGHGGPVRAASWSPDGGRVVTAASPDYTARSHDNTARIWDARTGTELLALKGHAGPVGSVAWSPDGSRLATAGGDKTARVWDTRSGAETLPLRGHTDRVSSAAWSPDGLRLLTGSGDGTARVWDAHSGSEVHTLRGHAGPVNGVSWGPDGSRLATAGADGAARLWDAKSGAESLALKGHAGPVHSAAWSTDGSRLATAGADGTARAWDARTGAPLLELKGHAGPVLWASWSPDGLRLATAGADGTARVWDARAGVETLTLKGHADRVFSASWSPDGLRLATGGADGTMRIWDTRTGAELLALPLKGPAEPVKSKGQVRPVSAVAWSPDGGRLATGGGDHVARVWDARTGAELLAAGSR